jgi:hypothetical protein
MESTCVETQTFYFMSNEGTFGMAQVIYSNVGYVGICFQCDFWLKISQWYTDNVPIQFQDL